MYKNVEMEKMEEIGTYLRLIPCMSTNRFSKAKANVTSTTLKLCQA